MPLQSQGAVLPRLWLGTWSMGGEGFGFCDARDAQALLDSAFEAGIRHFDTAGFYAHGKSEKLLVNLARHHRESIFISSKGGLEWQGRNVFHRASPESLRQSLQQSLKRLRTDYLDLYQLHWPDPKVPISDSLDALREFQQEGLIRHWGVCNLTAQQVESHILEFARIAHQVHHNPIHRSDDILRIGEQQQRCHHLAYSPLEQGLLGDGKSSAGLDFLGKKDFRRSNAYYHSSEIRCWLDNLQQLTDQKNIPVSVLTLAWIFSFRGVSGVIVGPKTLSQLQILLKYQDYFQMDQAVLMELCGETLWQHLWRCRIYSESSEIFIP